MPVFCLDLQKQAGGQRGDCKTGSVRDEGGGYSMAGVFEFRRAEVNADGVKSCFP